MRQYRLSQYGDDVQAAINKIIALANATHETDGLLSAEDKTKLDAIGIHYNTTAYWNDLIGYIPSEGEIIIYSDYNTITQDGETMVYVPGVKIGSGNAYVQDLAFVGADTARTLLNHITDTTVHVTAEKRRFWDDKLNVNDEAEVVNEVLVFNRN